MGKRRLSYVLLAHRRNPQHPVPGPFLIPRGLSASGKVCAAAPIIHEYNKKSGNQHGTAPEHHHFDRVIAEKELYDRLQTERCDDFRDDNEEIEDAHVNAGPRRWQSAAQDRIGHR